MGSVEHMVPARVRVRLCTKLVLIFLDAILLGGETEPRVSHGCRLQKKILLYSPSDDRTTTTGCGVKGIKYKRYFFRLSSWEDS